MSTKRSLLLACSLALVSAVATACGGGDGKSPKIRTFAATPNTLPTAGGETTLVWDVKNTDSLELLPGVGAVSGSALTLSVTETTTFTLVAKKDGRVDRKKTTVTCVAPGTISGIVRTTVTRDPLPFIAVSVNGEATLTDEAGRFYFDDVPTPYDVVVYATEGPVAVIYEGLTRFDPTIEFPLIVGGGISTPVDGTVTPTTAAANTTTFVSIKSTTTVNPGQTAADNGTGAYSTSVNVSCLLDCPPPVDKFTGVAMRYTYTTPGSLTYSHFGRVTKDVDPSVAETGFDIAMQPVANAIISARYDLESWETGAVFSAAMILDSASGASSDAGFILPPESLTLGTQDDFTLSTPDVEGQVLVWSQYADNVSGSLGIRAARLSPGESDVLIDLPELPRILTPVDGGIIDDKTEFRLSSPESAVNMFSFQGGGVVFIVVFTTRDSMTLPQLSNLGLSFQPGASLQFNSLEVMPAPSTDEIAGPDGIFGAQPEVFAFTQPRTLFYEPDVESP